MKNKEYHNVGTVKKSNREIVERGKLDTTNTYIHDSSLFSLETGGTSIKKNGGVKLVFFIDM
jgi:hypothetical protein